MMIPTTELTLSALADLDNLNFYELVIDTTLYSQGSIASAIELMRVAAPSVRLGLEANRIQVWSDDGSSLRASLGALTTALLAGTILEN